MAAKKTTIAWSSLRSCRSKSEPRVNAIARRSWLALTHATRLGMHPETAMKRPAKTPARSPQRRDTSRVRRTIEMARRTRFAT
jgi:hypothetical protein